MTHFHTLWSFLTSHFSLHLIAQQLAFFAREEKPRIEEKKTSLLVNQTKNKYDQHLFLNSTLQRWLSQNMITAYGKCTLPERKKKAKKNKHCLLHSYRSLPTLLILMPTASYAYP
ncbi:hypothetical protein HDV63DRAFT_366387 [Trichoderma sp. SZMC 28014]